MMTNVLPSEYFHHIAYIKNLSCMIYTMFLQKTEITAHHVV